MRAAVPAPWLAALLIRPGTWLPATSAPSPVSGRTTSPQRWAVLVFTGLLAACGARPGVRARALAFDLAAAVAGMPVRGRVSRRHVAPEVAKSASVRQLLRRACPGEAAAACLLALEASGALVGTPAMVEQARWRLGPGAEATDAQAVATAVAEVVWRCGEDAAALLSAIAARAGSSPA
ncbi:MAG TPA: hypothetical protein VFP65_09375 [Anaeromyxobacteraceae bacterium]|nr:hypothetical protein [Anaeromyxobacteraceae bacterium]